MEIGIVRDKRDRSPIGSRSSYWRNSPLNPMLSAIRKLAMTRASSSPSGFDRYPRPDAFDRLSQCSLSASFRLAGNTRHRLLTNRLRCYASLSHRPGFARESEAFTLNKVAHHPGGTGLESLRIEKTTLFMKDFLTNPQPCISSVAPSPFVRQSHSDCEAGSTSPR